MNNYRKKWQELGYLVIPNAVSNEQVERLREISERAYAQWRDESEPGSEPSNFHYQPSAWALLHLNHPKYYRDSPDDRAFLLDSIAMPFVVDLLDDIFEEEAVFMQSNLYVDPPSQEFHGGWHRDCQFLAQGEEQERIDFFAEIEPPRELHMHIPLVPTAGTSVVPGSHRRWDTPEEERVRRHDVQGEMPGALRLQLHPGDLAFFHVNSLHRGHYPVGVPRRTIAVSYGRASAWRPIDADIMRQWVGYRATYQPWFLNQDYLDGVTWGARAFFQRFIDIYSSYWQPEFLVPELGEKRIAYFRDYLTNPAVR